MLPTPTLGELRALPPHEAGGLRARVPGGSHSLGNEASLLLSFGLPDSGAN